MAAVRRILMPAEARAAYPAGAPELKSIDDAGAFEGYASLFHREDLGRDVVLPGAFRASLRARGTSGIKMLFQHDPAEPIGVWDEIREDGKGLYVRGRLATGVRKARDVLQLMRQGALDGLSIGFKAIRGQRDPKNGVRRLIEVDLWEISIVTFPMLADARVEAASRAPPARKRLATERDFERWLTRDAGLTRTEARAVLREGFKGLAARRVAAGHAEEQRMLARKVSRLAADVRAATHH
jgi:HK97 family phage prohead protease